MKFSQLTFSRFIAAIGIVCLHYAAPFLAKVSPQLGLSMHYINSFVSYFFLLSGFILVVSSSAKTHLPTDRQFWLNRFARVYPLYLFAFILTVVIIGIVAGPASLSTGDSFMKPMLASMLLVQAWMPDYAYSLNYPGWSLSVEVLFYGLFPLLFRTLSRLTSWQLSLLIAGCWVANQLFHGYLKMTGVTPAFTNTFPVFHLTTFLIGIGLGIAFMRHSARLIAHKRLIALSLLITLTLTVYLIGTKSTLIAHFEVGLFAPVFALIILYFCTRDNWLIRLFSQPRAVYLGEISYGVYILQAPVAMLVGQINTNYLHGNALVKFLLLLVVLLSVAALCHEWIEKPCRYWIRQVLIHKPAQPAVT